MRYRLAAVAALAMTGAACSRPHTDDNAFDWSQQLPAGSIVHLRDGTGKIEVRPSGNSSGHVHASTHWRRGRASDIHFVVSTAGPNEYYICAMWRGSGRCGGSGYHGSSRTGSFLQIFSLFHHGTDATANFVAELPSTVVLDATTTNGSVAIDGSAAGVRARAVNGAIDARHVSGPISIHTTNGEIHVAADSLGPSDSVDVSTVNGMIRAELPARTDGAWDLRVTNGVVRSDFALPGTSAGRRNRHLSGQIGTSTRSIRMRAVNGMVTVTHPTQAVAPAASVPPAAPGAGKNP